MSSCAAQGVAVPACLHARMARMRDACRIARHAMRNGFLRAKPALARASLNPFAGVN
jgi:hypothetical protein